MKYLKLLILGAVLTLGVAVAPAASAGILATEMCVTIYESTDPANDKWTVCDFPGSLHNTSLDGDVGTGFFNGCDGGANNWNDCTSRFSYTNLPASYRVRLYEHASYGGLVACADANGSASYNLTGYLINNRTSSWRVEGGNC